VTAGNAGFSLFLLTALPLLGQTAGLRGQVTDESGAVIPGARITVTGPSGAKQMAVSANDGAYSFAGLAPGDYSIEASAPDLALPHPVRVAVESGWRILNLQLKVVAAAQHMTVEESGGPRVATEASSNASALVIRGQDLQALADSPEDLQADLQALAGPSAGPNGGAIYIDGFSGGQMPAKDSIREIRINQNPFSPEYDKLGYGRIEIFTKPGTDKFRGTGFYNFGDSFWNSRDPYAQQKAPFLLKEYGGNLSGPLGKRASFFADIQRHSIDNGDIINAIVLDPNTLAIIDPYTAVFRTPQRRIIVSPRVDYQIGANNTLSVRYGYTHADIRDAGIGSLNVVSRGYRSQGGSNTIQVTETAVLGARVINEARFQFFRNRGITDSNDLGPAILVLGSVNGGGSQYGHSFSTRNYYEFQNYTSVAQGAHAFRFGVRVRAQTIDETSVENFGGTFTFGGGVAPELDASNQPVLDASGQMVLGQIDSIERYRRTLLFQKLGFSQAKIRELGGGATQFSIAAGRPDLTLNQTDIGLFAGDEWRLRPNLTLSLGLRYETQTNIGDWRDFAPRLGIAWAPSAKAGNTRPKSVIRAGFGLFYDRFPAAAVLTALRYNGVVQQQYVVTDPNFFPVVPAIASLAGNLSTQSIQKISATTRAPYVMQSAVSYERQLPWNTTIAFTYANSHGLHQLRTTDINAPLPGTYNPLASNSGVFPFGTPGPLFLMESSGLYNQHQLIANVNSKVNSKISLFGYYVYGRAEGNTDGLGTSPANPYNYSGEYGPAATDIRHRVSIGGSIDTFWNVRLSPLFIVSSGPPFDITTGSDVYGTTLFNARPGIPTDKNRPGLIVTNYGLLDPNPVAGEAILPRNFGRGPGSVILNLRVAKIFTFGGAREASASSGGPPTPGGGDRRNTAGVFNTGANAGPAAGAGNRRYSLSVSMSVRNILNHTNPGPIIGNITSPLFGQANQTAGAGSLGGTNFLENANNRRLELQVRFTF
jgi:hypothetical protein